MASSSAKAVVDDAFDGEDVEAYTIPEVAHKLRVHTDTVRARIAEGTLGHVRDGKFIRILPSQLAKYLNDHRVD